MKGARAVTAPILLTLDTNILIEASDGVEPSLSWLGHLRRFQSLEVVNLARTSRTQADLALDSVVDRRERTEAFVTQLAEISAPGRFEISKWGSDHWASADELATAKRLEELLGAKERSHSNRGRSLSSFHDVDHLLAHKSAGRHFFLTRDGESRKRKKILTQAGSLKELGILVLHPERALFVLERFRELSEPGHLYQALSDEVGWVPSDAYDPDDRPSG